MTKVDANSLTGYTVSLTEEQLMIVLAALSDRYCLLTDIGDTTLTEEVKNSCYVQRSLTEKVNREIRRQTGCM